MNRAIELKNNDYLDSTSIVHKRKSLKDIIDTSSSVDMMYYKNTNTPGLKWTYVTLKSSGAVIKGNNISQNGDYLQVKNCEAVLVSVNIHFTSASFSYLNDIGIRVNNDYYFFENTSDNRNYIITQFLVPLNGNTANIGVCKYTGDSTCNLITEDTTNFMSIELIGENKYI